MTFQHVGGDLKDHEPKTVAKFLFDFFRYQYETAVADEINTRAERNAFHAANAAAEREYKEENCLGWGPKLPYNEHVLKVKEDEMIAAQKQRADAKVCLDFYVKTFIDKSVT